MGKNNPEAGAQAGQVEAGAQAGQVEARVLVSGIYGQCNDVVSLSEAEVASGIKGGELDADPAAVAYAKSIAKPAE